MPDQPAIMQRIAAKALIIRDDGKLLILREASTYEDGTNVGKYHLPGGRINVGEPFLDGLRREVDEETGLEVEIGKPIFVGEWFPVIKGIPNQIIGMFFLCKAKTSYVRLSNEHDAFEWITGDELGGYDLMGPEPEAILAGLQQL